MLKRGIIFVFIVLFYISLASALSVTLTSVNSTFSTVSITSVSNLYAYEINFEYTGTVSSAKFNGFLGGGTSYGHSERGTISSVYESKLDNSKTGVSGSGSLFNVSYSGSLSLHDVLLVYSNSSEGTINYYCGDGECKGGETCSSCAADCGVCVSTTGGGSSRTSTGTATTATSVSLPDLSVSPGEFSISVVLDKKEQREFTIKNKGDKTYTLELSVENLEGAATLETDSLTLYPGEEKKVNINLLVSDKGFFVGNIIVEYSGSTILKIPVIINSRSKDFLFDVSVSLGKDYRTILFGKSLISEINLLQVGPQEQIDVIANYIIKDFEGNSYLEESETFYVLGEKKVVKEFATEILPLGKYVLGVEIVYPGAFAVSSTQFSVVEETGFSPKFLDLKNWKVILVVVLGSWVLMLFVVIVLVLIRNRKR